MIAALALGACTASPLDEVPIVGGSIEQREVAENTTSNFDVATGGAVDLREIRFVSSVGRQNGYDIAGRYTNERVLLLDTLAGPELERVLTHELCHALDHDLSLSDSDRTQLDHLRQIVLDDARDARSAEHERREVMARLCERGGPVASLLTVPSVDVPDAARRVFSSLRDVFTGSALDDAAPERGDTVRSAVHHEASEFYVSLRADEVLKLSWDGEEAWVDQWTGRSVERTDVTVAESTTTESPWGEDVPLRVHQAGEEAAGGVVVFAGLGNEVVVRYVLPAEGGWAVLPDPVAPLGHTQAWAANQWFWVATHEGESTTWTPVRR